MLKPLLAFLGCHSTAILAGAGYNDRFVLK
jgi:hypothetical protein